MTTIAVHCPLYQSALVYRYRQNPKGRDRFRYREYHRVFLLTYTYEARKTGVKEHITEMTLKNTYSTHCRHYQAEQRFDLIVCS
ncbi:hypothetical protein A6J66_000460 [Yersinia enterocolitica]|nr:hypothetical protein A6J66_000460 [Yersinia enterocolitica]